MTRPDRDCKPVLGSGILMWQAIVDLSNVAGILVWQALVNPSNIGVAAAIPTTLVPTALLVHHWKGPNHICLESEAQRHGITVKVCNIGSN